jgi:hypothetical protein
MENERDLKTLDTVPGRVMTRLRATLRLQLLRRDWTAIAKTEPPLDLSPSEQSSVVETIQFYKADGDSALSSKSPVMRDSIQALKNCCASGVNPNFRGRADSDLKCPDTTSRLA